MTNSINRGKMASENVHKVINMKYAKIGILSFLREKGILRELRGGWDDIAGGKGKELRSLKNLR